MKTLRKLLPHAAIILSMMYFVFFFIDRVNSAMSFIDNDITKALLFLLGVIAIVESVLLIRGDRAEERKRQLLRARRARQAREGEARKR